MCCSTNRWNIPLRLPQPIEANQCYMVLKRTFHGRPPFSLANVGSALDNLIGKQPRVVRVQTEPVWWIVFASEVILVDHGGKSGGDFWEKPDKHLLINMKIFWTNADIIIIPQIRMNITIQIIWRLKYFTKPKSKRILIRNSKRCVCVCVGGIIKTPSTV